MSPQNSVMFTANPQRIDSPTKFSVYCNSTEVLLSPWDMRINVMENIPPKEGQAQLMVHGSVVMSPVHAKALLQALAQTITLYEEKFGELDVQKILAAQKAMAEVATPVSE